MFALVLLTTTAPATLLLDARNQAAACAAGDTAGRTVGLSSCIAPGALSPILPAVIDGKAARILVEPGGPDYLTCNPDFVRRAGLEGRGPVSLASVGPVPVPGAFTETAVDIAGRKTRLLTVWGPLVSTPVADCIVGPRNLPFQVVRFQFAGRGTGQPLVLPFHSGARGRLYGRLPVGRYDLAVRFEHRKPRTVLTAPAAHAIAPTLGGVVGGAAFADDIAFGVRRPVRRFELDRPLKLGGLTIHAPFVRVADYGKANAIQSVDPEELVPGEVLVTGKRRPPGRNRLLRVGGNELDQCESLIVDKRRREIQLFC